MIGEYENRGRDMRIEGGNMRIEGGGPQHSPGAREKKTPGPLVLISFHMKFLRYMWTSISRHWNMCRMQYEKANICVNSHG